MTSAEPQKPSLFRLLSSDLFLGCMVALLSVLTAGAAYLGSISDSKEADANVEGQKTLSLSNTEFLRVNAEIAQDYGYFDNYYMNLDVRDDIADYYKESFSETLIASAERTDGPFDDKYYDDMYADADETYDEALAKFDEAQKAGDIADTFQLDVLIFAVALSLAAWASVVKEDNRVRPMFSALSLLISLVGLLIFFKIVFMG